MKRLMLVLLVLVLAACSSSTPTPKPTLIPSPTPPVKTKIPTLTPAPTKRPTVIPYRTKTPTESIAEIREDLNGHTIDILGTIPGVESLNMFRVENGLMEIEVKNQWASRDMQPDISYEIIKVIGVICKAFTEKNFAAYLDGEDPKITITTYSTDGDYKYQSTTDYQTCAGVGNLKISYEEWAAASDAGFK